MSGARCQCGAPLRPDQALCACGRLTLAGGTALRGEPDALDRYVSAPQRKTLPEIAAVIAEAARSPHALSTVCLQRDEWRLVADGLAESRQQLDTHAIRRLGLMKHTPITLDDICHVQGVSPSDVRHIGVDVVAWARLARKLADAMIEEASK